MEKKIRVGAVSYLNTKPLIYGFEQGMMKEDLQLVLDYPANLVSALQKNKIDIALLPVAAISNIKDAQVFSNYCIASAKEVASVCLFSEVPIEEVQEIYLDYQSKTSIALLRLLLKNHWNIRPSLTDAEEDYIQHIKGKKAGVIIGDRALAQLNNYPYVYDLASVWNEHTGLPFVFATWVSNIDLGKSFIKKFNEANQYGLDHLDAVILQNNFPSYSLQKYYTQNIDFILSEENKKGMTMFLKLLEDL